MKKKRNEQGDKLRECVRIAKLEVEMTTEQWQEASPRWHKLSRVCQRAANWYYELWLVWHVQNESAQKIETWLEQREAVKRDSVSLSATDRKSALHAVGKCPVAVMPKELAASIYQTLTRGLPDLTAHCMTIVINGLLGCLNGKAAHGVLPRWMASLLHHQKIPSFTDGLPIPFGNQDCELVKMNDEYFIDLKVWRMPVDGKKNMVCVIDRLKLRTKGRKCQNERAMLEKIFSGEWPFKGSQLAYDANRRKWFVSLGHQRTSHVTTIEPGRVAYLMPGCRNAFSIFWHDGKKWRRTWLQGRGGHIVGMRERVFQLRAERNQNYRHATARKGRGVNTAGRWRAKSAQTWRHFVRRVNHAVSKSATEWCVVNRVAKLIYKQPEGRSAESRFVSGNFKNSTWEFFQLGTMLAYKCQDMGIDLVVQKTRASGPVVAGNAWITREPDAVNTCGEKQWSKSGRGARENRTARRAAAKAK